ncbi:hypothetical protein [Helcobacillus massiliensis]|uniref:hypothetical protein n=1 Tax=Helcobacillus massiliensis TaxID=521392 RepID=UPI00255380DA|nr:hypothetical protein [Helcobacillus massiliensis]MDK7742865.1 hypothetical protein [Helcobacillus massiliensis]WOO94094.1 hypothetical protein R3I40_05855 [Helcobacillus massiliensis]
MTAAFAAANTTTAAQAAFDSGIAALPSELAGDVSRALQRTNYRGSTVSLAEGIGVIAGIVGGASGALPMRERAALAAIGALGLIDDLAEPFLQDHGTTASKGLRGHLGALRRGRLTTGAAKALAIPAAAAVISLHQPKALDRAIDTVLIAGSANLINLFDLRPGRALKATAALSAVPGLGVLSRLRDGDLDESARDLLLGILGVIASAAPADLDEVGMLGDSGANILGAAVGTAASRALPRSARAALAAALVGLTLASETVSFSRIIDSVPALRAIDRLGRAE